jgi:predicted HTH transcriptional regulator
MFDIQTAADLSRLRETVALECKLATGRDGMGAVPEDFWRTYSAFANTDGGVIILGVREGKGRFIPEGIANVSKVRKDLFDTLNNRQKVSVNLLTDAHVRERNLDGRVILFITVPRAQRKQRPCHLTPNPFGHTYRRLNNGDCVLPDDVVRHMIAEQVEDARDKRILPHFGMDDLAPETLRAYRNMFRSTRPAHPWLVLDDKDFLRQLGAWNSDRADGVSSLTVAGLLMFGKWRAITDEFPNYFLDYQEHAAADAVMRWTDRFVPDGTWSGNIFDFYRNIYPRLTVSLKIPFVLKRAQRQEDTLLHQSLREALINTLVHADYQGRVSVCITRDTRGFVFRNPGCLRVSREQALHGGVSDCRNPVIQQMFLMLGLGERAGSGFPKIIQGWKQQGHSLAFSESYFPSEYTSLEMRWEELSENTTQAAAENTTQAVGPNTTQAVGPNTTQAVGPNTTQAAGSNTTQAAGRDTTQAVGPNTTQATGRDTTQADGPNTTQAVGPHTTQAAGSNTTQAVGRDTTQAVGPNTTQAVGPNTTQATGPNTTQAAGPNTTQAVGPNTTQAVGPNTTQATGPNTTQAASPNTTQAAGQDTTQETSKRNSRYSASFKRLIIFAKTPRTRDELQKKIGIKNVRYFQKSYLVPLLREGYMSMTISDKPKSPMQRYCSTEAGLRFINKRA